MASEVKKAVPLGTAFFCIRASLRASQMAKRQILSSHCDEPAAWIHLTNIPLSARRSFSA